VLDEFKWTGNSNKLIFDFNNKAGKYYIYVKGNADFGKLNASITRNPAGYGANSIYFEVQGTGATSSIPGNSFIVANGSSGGGSKMQGTVYATQAGINIGSGTGSSTLTGAFYSPTNVTIQSGVTINYSQFDFCIAPTTANAGPDQTGLATCGLTLVTLAANTPTVGTGQWSVVSGTGGSFGNQSSPTSTFTGTPGTLYTLRWTITNSSCGSSSDDVMIKLNRNPQNVSAGTDIALDFNSQAILTGSTTTSGTTHLWTTTNPGNPIISDPTQFSITVNTQGIYVFTVTSSDGCSVSDQAEATAAIPSKIGSELKSVFDNFDPDNPDIDNPFYIITADGYILIEIASFDGQRPAVLTEISQSATLGFGFRNEIPNGTNPYWITGQFPIWNLPNLNNVAGINWARPYYAPSNNVGIVTSEGDKTMRSNFVKSGYEIDGTGVTVGVISDSYDAITTSTTASSLVPVPPGPQTFTTNTYNQDLTNNDLSAVTLVGPDIKTFNFPKLSDEGRAMMQIVKDVAPGVNLKFRTGILTARDMADGILQLQAAGVNAIVDDVTWIYEPFFKDGVVAQAVDQVNSLGVSYLTSAGNFGRKSYEKAFNPKDATSIGFPGKKAHDFSGSNDFFQKIRLAPGNYLFVFQWDDNDYTLENSGNTNDMDIFLTKNEDGSGLVGYNRTAVNVDAVEFIPITVSGNVPVDYNVLIINNTTGTTPPARIKYVVFRGDVEFLEYNEGNSTIVGHANSAGAMTVGATRFNHVPGHPLLPAALSGITKPEIETFSSIGGTTVNNIIREKPDFTAPDGVNTTVKLGQDYPNEALDGWSNFFGTSAAAPHAAGVAALIIEGKKKFIAGTTTVPPADIRALLRSTAVDMTATPGYDVISGYGLIDADAAMRTFAAPKPHQITLEIPEGIVPCDNPFTLTIHGENFSNESVVYLNDIPIIPESITPTLITVVINSCEGNPVIRVYTPPKVGTNGTDGGFSNSLKLFNAFVQITADNKTIKWGEPLPPLTATITVDGEPLAESDYTLAELGLENLAITTTATSGSDAGTYSITAAFGTPGPTQEQLSTFNYSFIPGTLTISKLHVTVTAENLTVVYGDPIPNIQFGYDIEDNNIPDEAAFINSLSAEHQSQIAKDINGNDIFGLINNKAFTIINGAAIPIINGQAVIIINGVAYTIINGAAYPIINTKALTIINAVEETTTVTINGVSQALTIINGEVGGINTDGLTGDQVNNTSFTATEASLANVRIFNNQGFIDISQEAVDDLKDDNGASIANVMSAVPNSAAFGVVDRESYLNGQAFAIINGETGTIDVTINGITQSVAIINQKALAIINKAAYPIINGVAYGELNGVAFPIINTKGFTIINGAAFPIINGAAFPIINGQPFTIINGAAAVPIINSDANTGVVISDDEPTGINNLRSLNTITGLEAGQQTILPGALLNNNIQVTYIPGTLTITPAPLEIKADNKTREYGEPNPELSATITGFKLGETLETSDVEGTLELTTDATNTSTAGNHPILVTQNLSSSNYSISYVNGNLNITKAQLNVTADDKTRTYGDPNPTFTATFTGFKNNETLATSDVSGSPAFTTTATAVSAASPPNYPINVSLGTLSSVNYSFNFGSGSLTINKAVLEVKADNKSRTYGDNNPALTVTYSGFKNGQSFATSGITGSPAVSTTATATSPASPPTYPITVTQGTLASGNYSFTFVNGALTINKALLTVKADDKTRPYGEDNPPLTASYTGFKNGETLASSGITGAPSLTTSAGKYSAVSPPTYPITITQGSLLSGNYSFTFINGTLTITNNSCLLTHSEFKSFGNTPEQSVSLWVNVSTKVRGRLMNHGDYLLFKASTITLNKIAPSTVNAPIYDGIIIADDGTQSPITKFDYVNNRWETKVPPGYNTTADVFLTAGIINSNTGFIKINGNTSSTLRGIFVSNVSFSDQWAYSIAAYSPQFTLQDVDGEGEVVSASADNPYKAGTPTTQIANLVPGGTGGGGNNYTGSNSSYDNFTACTVSSTSVSRELITSGTLTESNTPADAVTGIRMFPNPASGIVTVSYIPQIRGKSRIIISGIDGKKSIDMELGVMDPGQRYVNQFNISHLKNGVYLVQIINGNSVTSKKLVVIH
jgi:hypothetical protein